MDKRKLLKGIGISTVWAAPVVSVISMPAHAQASPMCGETITLTGPNESTVVVPTCATTMQVEVAGASGGDNQVAGGVNRLGGLGSVVTATIAVTPGQMIGLFAGGAGESLTDNAFSAAGGIGFGNGGDGISNPNQPRAGSGGGGSSAITIDGSAVVIAGGGGGAGTAGLNATAPVGGDAGSAGGGAGAGQPGSGGTSGAAGTPPAGIAILTPAEAGGASDGGNGGAPQNLGGGGGGGAGYGGGGGGTRLGGGGGGGSLAGGGSVNAGGAPRGNGSVTITFL